MRYAPKKTIPVPPFGRVDVSDYTGIINTSAFQRLKYKKQLSLVGEVFPAAIHTRYLHSIGVMHVTKQIVDDMFKRGFFEGVDQQQLERDLCITALVHDIGHPAYSHMVEYVLMALTPKGNVRNHNEVGIEIIKGELAEVINDAGGDLEEVVRFLDKTQQTPGNIITAKSVGADKLGYLFQDQYMTGYDAINPIDIRSLIPYIGIDDAGLVVEEKAIDLLKSLQRFYFGMYTQVYLRKQCLAIGRVLQKALEFHLRETGFNPDLVWNKPEGWINTQLSESPIKKVRQLYSRISNRNVLRTAVSFKLEDHVTAERIAGKSIAVVPISRDEGKSLGVRYKLPTVLTALEASLAEILGIEEHAVAVTTVPDPNKLVPEDVSLVDNSGRRNGTLFGRLPSFQSGLLEDAEAFFALRVIVDEEYRNQVASQVDVVRNIIMEGIV
jgi:HD superfamily phosphohydrolase